MNTISLLLLLLLLLNKSNNLNAKSSHSPFLQNPQCVLGDPNQQYGSVDVPYCKEIFKKPFFNFPIARNDDIVYFNLLGTSLPSNVNINLTNSLFLNY